MWKQRMYFCRCKTVRSTLHILANHTHTDTQPTMCVSTYSVNAFAPAIQFHIAVRSVCECVDGTEFGAFNPKRYETYHTMRVVGMDLMLLMVLLLVDGSWM